MVTTVRLPEELHRRIKESAQKKGLTVNAVVVSALWESVEGRKCQKKAEHERG